MSIRFEDVSKSFGPKTVLNHFSFEVPTGEILFVLGKSGAGKSVLLKHIVGLLKPDSGHVYVDDQEVRFGQNDELSEIRQKCGMVFQQPALLDSLSVFDNIAFGLRARRAKNMLSEVEIRKVVLEKISLVHLGPETLDKFPPELSYGMQKRVSLARTIAPGPSFLLFDEPTTGLDPIV